MTNFRKVSGLPAAGPLDGTEDVLITQAGVSRRAKTRDIGRVGSSPTTRSVMDYYELSDGQDIGIALRRARTAGALAAGNTLTIPGGSWTVSASDPTSPGYMLNMTGLSRCKIEGAGPELTILTAANGANLGWFSISQATDVTISGMSLRGNRATQTLFNRHGIRGVDWLRVTLSDMVIFEALAYGIGMQAGFFLDTVIENILFDRSGADHIDIKNPTGTNRNNIIRKCRGINQGQSDKSKPKAGFDVRGQAIIEDTVCEITDATGYATNHSYFRCRPDQTASINYKSATATPEDGWTVTGTGGGSPTASIRYVNPISGTTGVILLQDVVGVFTPNQVITITDPTPGSTNPAITAAVNTYTAPANNGGGNTIMKDCRAVGPTNGVVGIAFAVLDDAVVLDAPQAKSVRTGILTTPPLPGVSGGANMIARNIRFSGMASGAILEAPSPFLSGGHIELATDDGVEIIDYAGATIEDITFRSCGTGVRHRGAATGTSLRNLEMESVTTPYSGISADDYVAINCAGLDLVQSQSVVMRARPSAWGGRALFCHPGPAAVATTALTGGAGGAANSVLYFYPLPIHSAVRIARIGTNIGTPTAGVAGKMALYADNFGTPAGGALLLTAPTTIDFNLAAKAMARLDITPYVLPQRLYWLALVANGAARPYTIPPNGPMGEFFEYVGGHNTGSFFVDPGSVCSITATALVDYNNPFPSICPAVGRNTSGVGAPFLAAWEG